MSPSLRLAVFTVAVVIAVTIGFGVGRAAGPFGKQPAPMPMVHEVDQP